MWKFLKDYFTFTRSELRIILILSVLLLVVLLIRLYTGSVTPTKNEPSDKELRMIEEFLASLELVSTETKENVKPKTEVFYDHLKVFDPNKVSVNDLNEMGFPEKVISNITKYRKSGGYFLKPQEFKKIYGITDSAYYKIVPYLSIIDTGRKERIISKKYARDVNKPKTININTADSSNLVALNGIGPGFALRIIKYRNRLGGFIFPEQILEIFGMDSTRFDLFKEWIYIDTADVKRIDINKVSLSDLRKHPYIDEQSAASIIKFRDFKGRIMDIHELKSYNIINKDKLKKIEPYLRISYQE